MFIFRCCTLVLAACMATGCALRETQPKAPQLPESFAGHAGGAETWPSARWYEGFGSAELQALVAEAAANNLDLAMARARIMQADARARQAGAAILPSVDAGANGNYLAGHSSSGGAHETDWAALLSASYEIDFWGKNRATARSAHLQASASRADRDTLALTTLAGVANAYFQVLSLRERLAIAYANVDAAKKLLDIVQARFDAGLSNPVELAIQKSTLAAAALVIPDLRQQESEGLAALAVLLGRAPEQFSIDAQSLDTLVEPAVAPGLPSELLTRRPDVYMAEANMRAANADLTVARAALFPSLSLTASGGVQNPALNAAVISLSGVGPTLSLGASISQVIFDGGRLRAARAEAQAKQEELVTAYRAAILAALVDVENALSALHHLDDARALQDTSLAQSERAFEGATLRFKAGSGDFLTTLEAQRTLYAAREQFSQYRLTRLQTLVALCKSLGGGWQAQDSGYFLGESR
ncbi:MAG TPA: efflux transporter outer membrane subunit [Steroidobacteraceae bacterium]|nr:efflux transporter outer membrane subunit [Steroidobacteraceae bacterium]